MRIRTRRIRKDRHKAASGGEKGRMTVLRDLKVCFKPCRCYATGKKPKEA
jgi:hypothetical protein